jgi:small nuclear ribonucleoprotein (snRNP)-like protein
MSYRPRCLRLRPSPHSKGPLPPPHFSRLPIVCVCVFLRDGQLVQGTLIAFDRVQNPILRDCIELHPQAGRHVTEPQVFPSAVIASLTIETLLSPSPPSGSVGAPPLALSSHLVPSPPPLSHRLGGRLRSLLPHHSYYQLVISLSSSPPLPSFLYRCGERFHPLSHLSKCIGSFGTILP